ncbi:MAG TPA: helix-turn-helix transcriptional regulator [Streptosporangiaceae bacterium]|nr:helix-turn-helix transcriptional regulator [Streptosporangiaceae bacterium]
MPGLRREELALLAGVSASYYTRLEQGQSLNASPEVLDAIAQALRLDESERVHLQDLARAGTRRGRPRRPAPERVTAATSELVHALADVPAIVIGRRSDVLAWNRMGHALFAGHVDAPDVDRPAERPNMARLVFLDAHTRELYADWPSKARAVVGNLRLTGSGDHDRRPLTGHVRAGVPDPRRRDSAVSRLLEPAGPGRGPELLNGLDRLRDRGAPW